LELELQMELREVTSVQAAGVFSAAFNARPEMQNARNS
jgi:hypothetical protein